MAAQPETVDVKPDDTARDAIEAAAFRRLTALLRHRTDVQNVDLMGVGGFCRNCLSDWLAEAAADRGVDLSKDAAREWIYGMTYADYKASHQTPASQDQIDRMAASVARNRADDAALDDSFPASDPPSASEPTSPMKISAGCALYQRKPMLAPTMAPQKIVTSLTAGIRCSSR